MLKQTRQLRKHVIAIRATKRKNGVPARGITPSHPRSECQPFDSVFVDVVGALGACFHVDEHCGEAGEFARVAAVAVQVLWAVGEVVLLRGRESWALVMFVVDVLAQIILILKRFSILVIEATYTANMVMWRRSFMLSDSMLVAKRTATSSAPRMTAGILAVLLERAE
ncbi:hypothetical protein PRK78_001861 [Emydomyces testavorans]|uniref:Uncharacterized protein n=1 Tax=Emydomyces testavorans TaxID=2070801 RepID=A0AAF0DDT3_9EURO|nr:hypothetical protein PRK78_001861 [Emydomyces testavorans]